MLKRLFDFVVSLLGFFLLLPMFALITLAIKLDSAGPVFYRGSRAGILGKPFRIFKFRTMVVNADKIGGPSTADDDPRITRVGKLLRKYKLDEMSQLLNVLKGEMSLVGPRPEVQQYVELFTDDERAILTIRPGITDWATLWNTDEGAVLAGNPDAERTYLEKIRPTKIALQLAYARERSFSTDLNILFQTLLAIFVRPKPGALSIVEKERSAHGDKFESRKP
jgi:lipopolysaccharide/colanic/teichoic acid biosynthesis glycosyltransferase